MTASSSAEDQATSTRKMLFDLEKFRKWGALFLISSLSLFLELAVIRWISGEVRLFAYFKNLPLLAAFLGLAIGFGVVGKKLNFYPSFAPLFLIFSLLVFAFNRLTAGKTIIYPGGGDEFFWYTVELASWLTLLAFLGTIVVFFMLIVFLFIPLGQLVGEEMTQHDPVPAYVVNILASLFGVWIFTLVSYFSTPPLLWFGLFVIGLIAFRTPKFRVSLLSALLLIAALITIFGSDRQATWSPYNRLSLSRAIIQGAGAEAVPVGFTLDVQQVFYQRAIDLSDEFVQATNIPELDSMALSYNLPYQLVEPGSNVLIVGAGMGNDVAAAIRNDMGSVTAVEIDASIVDYGRQYHPENPYQDARVQVIIDDARSFFNTHTGKFDLIVFGLLDSHTLLSSLSSVRLDSYVYTVESFQQVKRLLKENGVVALTFAVNQPWIEEKIARTMAESFGSENIYYFEGPWEPTFISGAISEDLIAEMNLRRWEPAQIDVSIATDDWPYLYLRSRKIPAAYWQSILLIGILCLALIGRSFPETLRPNWHFWLLGAAFLLIEFKAITELALLFGTTWLVNALAISGVLVMALLANLFVLRTARINLLAVYGLLFASLVASLIFPLSNLAGLSPVLRGIASTVLLTLPLLFAGVIFSESLRRFGDTSKPLASNFSGSVAGGLLEYTSIWWGIKSLYWIAIVLYLGAMVASRFQKQ